MHDLNIGMWRATHIQCCSTLTDYAARLFSLFFFPNIFSYFPQYANHRKHICPAGGINQHYCISGPRACCESAVYGALKIPVYDCQGHRGDGSWSYFSFWFYLAVSFSLSHSSTDQPFFLCYSNIDLITASTLFISHRMGFISNSVGYW